MSIDTILACCKPLDQNPAETQRKIMARALRKLAERKKAVQ